MSVSKTEPIEKTAAAVIAVSVDWRTWLTTDTLVGLPTIQIKGTVTTTTPSTTGNITTFNIGGGAVGSHRVTVTATSSSGRVEPVYINVKVVPEP